MLIGTVFIIAYTVMGGFFAVAWTDLIQGIIMLGTLIVLPLVAWAEVTAGGIDVAVAIQNAGPKISSLVAGKSGWLAVAAIMGGLSWGVGYLGQPHVIIRFMSIKSVDAVRQARVIAFFWALLAFTGAFFIGLFGLALIGSAPGGDAERLMPLMATQLLPGWLAGIFISGAVAAMMSTADSQLLVATSAVAEDVVHQTFVPNLNHRDMVKISRLTALVVGSLAFILALTSKSLIYNMVSYAWAGLGSSFGPAIVFSLHWKRTTGAGVMAGMIVGSASTVIWANLPQLNEAVTVRLVSFVAATLAVWLVSLLTSRKAVE